jgi:hypothetical protein
VNHENQALSSNPHAKHFKHVKVIEYTNVFFCQM